MEGGGWLYLSWRKRRRRREKEEEEGGGGGRVVSVDCSTE